ncbi:MAG: carboxyvinyl-carboxyphosphonate phosphorylmutase [Acidobacteria bacterium]|nr:MAG: carboxyvinyl-carboxyphosphonate phosphorylmutase [Acidobacteriota bacterium]
MTSPNLKELLQRDQILVVPASYDMVSAKLIERAGFEAVYLSGYGHAASHLGLPDAGLISFSEMLERLHNLVRSVQIPVLADADTGFGGATNVRRTVQEYEWAGAQAIQIEDQEFPKKCGHTAGKRLVKAEEMTKKIEAARASRRSDNFLVIARTDAISVAGIDEAIRRGRLYQSAGADIIFIESPATVEQIRRIANSFQKPLMLNQIESGQTPTLPVRELQALGYKIAAYALTALMASVRAMQRTLKSLQREGSPHQYLNDIATFEELDELFGFPEVRAWEKRFQLE